MILTNELKGISTKVLQSVVAGEAHAVMRLSMLDPSRLGGNTPKVAAWNELFRRHLGYLCAVECAETQRKKV